MLHSRACLLLLAVAAANVAAIDRWCGKAYKPSDPAVDPGGWLEPPPFSKELLLDLKIQPRVSLYLPEDTSGTFLIDTTLSHLYGQSFKGPLPTADSSNEWTATVVRYDTRAIVAQTTLAINQSNVPLGFDLTRFEPSMTPYNVFVHLAPPHYSSPSPPYIANTSLLRLSERTDGGSVVKIDNLYGSLLVRSTPSQSTPSLPWRPIFPFSYYMDGGWVVRTPNSLARLAELGYNMIHMVPPYNFDELDGILTEAAKHDLWVMYDMRHTYVTVAEVQMEVKRYMNRSNMLLWYTADEPDGWTSPPEKTGNAFDAIKALDPYHPVSLVLNCKNYLYEKYSAGADIVLSDPYPVGTNTSHSTVWETVCNTTYGDCGCDNCHGMDNLTEVGQRIDTLAGYAAQLSQSPRKPQWSVLQAFGAQEYWKRAPTAAELAVMTMLAVNHGAKGSVAWLFPAPDDLINVSSKLAKVLTSGPCVPWILGAPLQRLFAVTVASSGTSSRMKQGSSIPSATTAQRSTENPFKSVDVTAWVTNGIALISIINPNHFSLSMSSSIVAIPMPEGCIATRTPSPLWASDNTWALSNNGRLLILSSSSSSSFSSSSSHPSGSGSEISGTALSALSLDILKVYVRPVGAIGVTAQVAGS